MLSYKRATKSRYFEYNIYFDMNMLNYNCSTAY